jgi:pyruvate kinase
MRATKIIATIGPACDEPGIMDLLAAAGMDTARLNASHSERGDLERRLASTRAAGERCGRHIGVMLDLGGPKIRVGEVRDGTMLEAGGVFVLTGSDRVGDATGASVSYPRLADDVSPGDTVMLDDGAIELRVSVAGGGEVVTEVVSGGPLGSHKGVNVPGVRLGVEATTAKDLEDLEWALGAGVDMVAQSFVRDPDDILRLRAAMGERAVPIVAKIEKHEAVACIEAIVAAADAVMVARGDLGVETSPEAVPVIQRRIVAAV